MESKRLYADGVELESWLNLFYFDILDEWECLDNAELELWDWLKHNYPDVLEDYIELNERTQ